MTALRLSGLDLARAWALLGMLIVNFRVALGVDNDYEAPAWLQLTVDALSGRAAALFVVLAGMGLALATRNLRGKELWNWVTRRSLFLAVIGGVNLMIFPPDILHYYAVYFVLGAVVLGIPRPLWPCIAVGLTLAWPLLAINFDYNSGWNWVTLTYEPLNGVSVLLRHTLFNGWHPLIPWGAFLVWGLWLQGLRLEQTRTAQRLFVGGVLALLLGLAIHWAGITNLSAQWHGLLSLEPLPPSPLYVLTAGGIATALIGLALLAVRSGHSWALLTRMGRMTLTLYLAHIFIGMGTMEAFGMLTPSRESSLWEVTGAAALFAFLAAGFAWAWSLRFRQGPVEGVMRWLTRT
ncbi:COG2311 Predicted membrane protein [Comamonadaceae bacterium]